jgi:hypothetical protein
LAAYIAKNDSGSFGCVVTSKQWSGKTGLLNFQSPLFEQKFTTCFKLWTFDEKEMVKKVCRKKIPYAIISRS